MKLKAHHYYARTIPGHAPRRVFFLGHKGNGTCRVVDHLNAATTYPIVPREQLSKWIEPKKQLELFNAEI